MPLTVALDVRAQLGECPIWDADEQALYFVDIKGMALHRFHPATGGHAVIPMPEEIGCIGFRKGGGFIAGFRSGLWLLDSKGGREAKLADNPEDQRTSRFNDGRVDPAGRFLAGTIDEPKDGGKAHLYRYDRRGLVTLAGGLLTSNGVAFSPDGRTLYHSDTPTFTVWRYAYDPASGRDDGQDAFRASRAHRQPTAAAPTVPRWMLKAATGRPCSRVAASSATRRMGACWRNMPFRPDAPPWSASAGPTGRRCT